MQRMTVTLDDELVAEIDRFMQSRLYNNRSEAFRDLARAGLQQAHEATDEKGDCVAALVYVYDYDVRELPKRLAAIRHQQHDLIVATMHVQLDHENCLEVALLRGQTAEVRHLEAQVTAERGVRHGRLVLVPVKVSLEKHAHGTRRAHKHVHVRVREAGS